MNKLYAPSTIKGLKDSYDFKFSKSLGQNFLTDRNIVNHIVEGAGVAPGDLVIEIGPGIGVITWEAAQIAEKVIAVEIDKTLIPILEETLGQCDNVQIVNQDILKTDINQLIAEHRRNGQPVKIIGNLPYYITTPIIMKILEERVPAESITIMMQKEVAERINAQPSTKDYGSLSVAVQYYCDTRIVAHVPKEVFMPQPKVGSSVLRLDIRKDKKVELINDEVFFQCVKAGFGQRRKTLLNSMMGVKGATKEIVKESLKAAGIDPARRAETLNLDEFAELSNRMACML